MALMFTRIARNFARNGYFPTDEVTLARIMEALAPCANGEMRILDPCAGEGVALAEAAHHLGVGRVQSLGVEYDAERAWHAKTMLGRCLHSDLFSMQITRRSVGLLWLNPPYGDLVTDRGMTAGKRFEGRSRLEKLFYERTIWLLQPDGVLVLIVPRSVLDEEFCGWIAGHFTDVEAFLAPEQKFKQVVVLGRRRRSGDGSGVVVTRKRLRTFAQDDDDASVLPEVWTLVPYTVPAVPHGAFAFQSMAVEPRQLAVEIGRFPTLWNQFDVHFGCKAAVQRRPLRRPSDWHLALLLAAGDISGVVTARDGRQFVVKGSCHKEKQARTEIVMDDDGNPSEVRTLTDKFVSQITALDFTPGSEMFGRRLTIL